MLGSQLPSGMPDAVVDMVDLKLEGLDWASHSVS